MNRQNHKSNAWKRYGVLFMAGMLLAGTAAGTGVLPGRNVVIADAADKPRVTLRTPDNQSGTELVEADEDQDEEAVAEEATDEEITENIDAEAAEDAEADEDVDAEEEKDEDVVVDVEIPYTETADGVIAATDVSDVAENVYPAMVTIHTTQTVQESQGDNGAYSQNTFDPYSFFGGNIYRDDTAEEEVQAPSEPQEVVEGSTGIIISKNDRELLIATANYAVENKESIKVFFGKADKDEEGIAAKVKGIDSKTGLAVIVVKLADIPEDVLSEIRLATLGTSEELKPGQPVISVGNAYDVGISISTGIVSAVGCEDDSYGVPILMLDTTVSAGNSGGAIFDTEGKVIGIMIGAMVDDGATYNTGAMTCAVGIDDAVPALEQLLNRETRDKLGDNERGYIGATVITVSDDAKDLYDMPEGAFVYSVNEDSPAEKAGIKKGDIITLFNGETVTGSDDLIEKISYYKNGETVILEVLTANAGSYEAKEVEVTLEGSGKTEKEDEDIEETETEEEAVKEKAEIEDKEADKMVY